MRRAVLAGLILAACSGKKESAPAPSASEASAPASAGAAPIAAVSDAAAPAADRYRTLIVPEIDAAARPPAVSEAPIVVIAMLQVSFEGAPVVRVMGGKVDPKARDAQGVVTALSELYAAYAAATPPGPTHVNIAAMPQLPSRVVLDVMGSIAVAGQDRFALMVRTSEGVGALRTTLRSAAMTGAAPRFHVAVSREEVKFWEDGAPSVSEVRTAAPHPHPDLWASVRLAAQPRRGDAVSVLVADDVPVRDLIDAVVAVSVDDTGQRMFERVVVGRWTPPPPPAGDDRAAIEEEASRYAAMLTAEDDSGASGVSGDMSKTAPGGDLAAQIEDVRRSGTDVKIGGGVRGDDPRTATGRGPATAYADALYAEDDDAPRPPSGRIQVVDKRSFDETSLTADMVVRKIMSAYMPGVKRCYKHGLETDPTMRGKLAIQLTVNEVGRVVSPKATGFDAAVDACVEGQLASWRFPVPKDEDGEATEAGFQLTFALSTE